MSDPLKEILEELRKFNQKMLELNRERKMAGDRAIKLMNDALRKKYPPGHQGRPPED